MAILNSKEQGGTILTEHLANTNSRAKYTPLISTMKL